jgi:hypothetical protein
LASAALTLLAALTGARRLLLLLLLARLLATLLLAALLTALLLLAGTLIGIRILILLVHLYLSPKGCSEAIASLPHPTAR